VRPIQQVQAVRVAEPAQAAAQLQAQAQAQSQAQATRGPAQAKAQLQSQAQEQVQAQVQELPVPQRLPPVPRPSWGVLLLSFSFTWAGCAYKYTGEARRVINNSLPSKAWRSSFSHVLVYKHTSSTFLRNARLRRRRSGSE
jgi:hypothetical protein